MLIHEKKTQEQREGKNFAIVAFVFFAIYFNLSSLGVSLRISNEIYLGVSLAVYLIIFLVYSLINKTISFNAKGLILIVVAYISIFLTMIVNQDFGILNIVIILQLFMALLFIHIITFDDFVRSYVRVMLFISAFSLIIMFIIVPFFQNIVHLFPLRYNSTGLAVRDYIFGFHFESHSVAARRNTGIFREMGVYQHFLNIALLFYLFYLKQNKLSVILILSVTIITTYSTPGIIFLFIILSVYLYENYRNRFLKGIKFIFAFIFIFSIMNIVASNTFNDFIYAINKFLEQGNSYNGRLGAIIGNIFAWAQSPVFGNGIEKGIILAEELYLGQFTTHNTSTTTSFMAIYGLFFSIIMSVPLMLLLYRLKIRRISKILLIVAFFLSINSERFIYDQLYYIFVFSYFMQAKSYKKRC